MRYYVIAHAERPGIYYGEWESDGIRLASEGNSKPDWGKLAGGVPTSKAFKTLAEAADFAHEKKASLVFRGPRIPHPTALVIG